MAKGRHAARGGSGRWRSGSLLISGFLIGTLLITPAGADFRRSVSHLIDHMKGTFYTKSQADARFASRAASASMPLFDGNQPVCDPEGSSFLACVIVELELPTASRVLLNGRITGHSPGTPGMATCRFGSTHTNPVEETTLHKMVDQSSDISLVGLTDVFPAGEYSFGIDCADPGNGGVKFWDGKITAVAVSRL